MGLLPLIGGHISSGSLHLDGIELTGLNEKAYRSLRGSRIALISQNPMTSLDPLLRVGHQIDQVARLHLGLSSAAAKARSIDLLTQLQIPDAVTVYQQYPHQMSGGMKQRIVIAMALVGDPDMIIADEPTTALDVTIQAQIIRILVDLVRSRGMALMLITHDMGVVAQACDDVVVLYAGRVAEASTVSDVLLHPVHPYTLALIACITRSDQRSGSLKGIPGLVPSVTDYDSGCRFHPRCNNTQARCKSEVPLLQIQGATKVSCHFPVGVSRD
ncbi:ABC transporter ATP-binding protein [Polaromonas sp.]|nr:ABC transporter ATP-binding protein [Polaromonas sp.]